MTESDDTRREIGDALTERRVEISPEYKNLSAFSRATGVNYKNLQRIESGADHRFSTGTLLELDRAYQYPAGTIRSMLDGSSPPTPPLEGPLLVPRGTRPAIEEAEPTLRLRGAPPLRAGETLEGWPRDDGQWHYHYVEDGEELDIRLPAEADTPLEDVVRRLRAMAAIAAM